MEQAKKKKLRSVRVIATNMFMGLSVIVIVSVFTLIAMGYTFNKDWGLEQSGLIQISSRPSGATVEIDGEVMLNRTEMSKMLSSGEHTIKISKPGYDVWQRVLNLESGLLTRVDWARLFPIEKNVENLRQYTSIRFVSVSPDNQYILLLPEKAGQAQLINIKDDDVKYSTLDLRAALGLGKDEIPLGKIEIMGWNKNSDKFLLKWMIEEETSWFLIDRVKPADSVNLSLKFLLKFDELMLASDAADKIWVLENGNLRLINTNAGTISGVLASGVEAAVNNSGTIAYVRKDPEVGRIIELLKEGEQGGTTVHKVNSSIEFVQIALGDYWGDGWIAYSLDSRIFVRSGSYPSYGKSASSLKTIVERDIGFVPEFIETSPSGRFVAAANKKQVATVDVELREYWKYDVETELKTFNWLDDYIIWEIRENKLVVRDFDGNNRREISEAANDKVVSLTENDRWLYFIAPPDEEGVFALKRQKL